MPNWLRSRAAIKQFKRSKAFDNMALKPNRSLASIARRPPDFDSFSAPPSSTLQAGRSEPAPADWLRSRAFPTASSDLSVEGDWLRSRVFSEPSASPAGAPSPVHPTAVLSNRRRLTESSILSIRPIDKLDRQFLATARNSAATKCGWNDPAAGSDCVDGIAGATRFRHPLFF